MTNRIVHAMVGKVGGIPSKGPPFLPYNKIPRHLLKSIRSYVKGTNTYVIHGGVSTFKAHGWGLEWKCIFMRELPCKHKEVMQTMRRPFGEYIPRKVPSTILTAAVVAVKSKTLDVNACFMFT
jgi:hypothetical protein